MRVAGPIIIPYSWRPSVLMIIKAVDYSIWQGRPRFPSDPSQSLARSLDWLIFSQHPRRTRIKVVVAAVLMIIIILGRPKCYSLYMPASSSSPTTTS